MVQRLERGSQGFFFLDLQSTAQSVRGDLPTKSDQRADALPAQGPRVAEVARDYRDRGIYGVVCGTFGRRILTPRQKDRIRLKCRRGKVFSLIDIRFSYKLERMRRETTGLYSFPHDSSLT